MPNYGIFEGPFLTEKVIHTGKEGPMGWICPECKKPEDLHLFLGTNPVSGKKQVMCLFDLPLPIMSEDLEALCARIREQYRLAEDADRRNREAMNRLRRDGRDFARALAGKYRARIKTLIANHNERVDRLKSDHGEAAVRLQDKGRDELKQCSARYARLVEMLREEHGEEIVRLKMEHQREIEALTAAKPQPDAAKLKADNVRLAKGFKDVNDLNNKLEREKKKLEEDVAEWQTRVAELEAEKAAQSAAAAPNAPLPPPDTGIPDDAVCGFCEKAATHRVTVAGKTGVVHGVLACDKQNHRQRAVKAAQAEQERLEHA